MKASCFAILCLAFCAVSVCGRRELLEDESSSFPDFSQNSNVAVARSSAKARDGTAKSTVISTSKSTSEAKNAVAKSVSVAIGKVKNGEDVGAVANAHSYAIAKAVAKAYTKTLVYVETTGSDANEACGSAYASAEAAATSYASAFAKGVAIALNKHGIAHSVGEASSISAAIAYAFSQAESEACTHGEGKAISIAENLSSATATAYAEALVNALSLVKDGKAIAVAKGDGKSHVKDDKASVDSRTKNEVRGEGFANSGTEGDAYAEGVPICRGIFARCCRQNHFGRYYRTCRCGNFFSSCRARLDTSYPEGGLYTLYRYRGRSYQPGYKCRC